ncbi:MAG: response regulator [Campylobacterales bacterium]|nr:response regulator [Campylobacterales bacterium]
MNDTYKICQVCSEFSVLLVDDDEDVRTRIYDVLLLFFPAVYSAKDGKEALKIYEQRKADIIITDLTMPKMNGFEFIKAVRSINQKQKIIVMSAHTETDIIIESIQFGIDGYLLKPLNTNQMFETIEKTVISLKMERDAVAYQEELESIIDNQDKQLIKQFESDLLTDQPNKGKLILDFKTNKTKLV